MVADKICVGNESDVENDDVKSKVQEGEIVTITSHEALLCLDAKRRSDSSMEASPTYPSVRKVEVSQVAVVSFWKLSAFNSCDGMHVLSTLLILLIRITCARYSRKLTMAACFFSHVFGCLLSRPPLFPASLCFVHKDVRALMQHWGHTLLF